MADEIYHKLAKALDTLPNGFPATESGVEIEILKRIFTEEQAGLFCDMRLTFETAEQIAERTGRPLAGFGPAADHPGRRRCPLGPGRRSGKAARAEAPVPRSSPR